MNEANTAKIAYLAGVSHVPPHRLLPHAMRRRLSAFRKILGFALPAARKRKWARQIIEEITARPETRSLNSIVVTSVSSFCQSFSWTL